MSRSARDVFINYSRIDLGNELQEMEWVTITVCTGPLRDIRQPVDDEELAMSLILRPTERSSVSIWTRMCSYRIAMPDSYLPETVKLKIINVLCSKFREELGSGLNPKFLPDVRGLAMLLWGEPFVDLRHGFHYDMKNITDEEPVNYGSYYMDTIMTLDEDMHHDVDRIAPPPWQYLFGYNPVLNHIVYALAALFNRLGVNESELRRLKHSLSMNQES